MKSERESGVSERQSLSIINLLQLAWQLAHLDLPRPDIVPLHAGQRPGSDPWLLEFWSTTRGLSQSWEARRTAISEESGRGLSRADVVVWENLAMEILAGDFLARILATVVASRELQAPGELADSPKARPILMRSVEHLEFARSQLLKELVQHEWADVTVGRLFPRIERWTDLLIGRWIVGTGVGVFARDPRRAWDFGEDQSSDTVSGLRRQLLQRSFEGAFRGRLVEVVIREPQLVALYRLAAELELKPTNRELSEAEQVSSMSRSSKAEQFSLLERSLRLHADRQRPTPS